MTLGYTGGDILAYYTEDDAVERELLQSLHDGGIVLTPRDCIALLALNSVYDRISTEVDAYIASLPVPSFSVATPQVPTSYQ